MPPKPTSSPPAGEYRREIDTRPLFSPALASEAARTYAAISIFFAPTRGAASFAAARRPPLTVKTLAEVLGHSVPRTKKSLDELASVSLLDKGPTGWSTVPKPSVDGRSAARLKVGDRPACLTKLDGRPFFARDLPDDASRLWAVASILSSEVDAVSAVDLSRLLGLDEDDVDGSLRELARLGLARLTIGADGTEVRPLKLSPKAATGMTFVEYTCKELGREPKTLGTKTAQTRLEECKRRAASRGAPCVRVVAAWSWGPRGPAEKRSAA